VRMPRGSRRSLWMGVAASAVCCIGQPVQAAGPSVAAKADWQLWRQPINSPADFDKASRAAILIYVGALADMQKINDADLQAALRTQSLDRPSVDKWLAKTWSMSARNYQIASGTCEKGEWTCGARTSTVDELVATARVLLSNAPADMQAWKDDMDSFVHAYISEQLKLAAIFPKANSEVDLFNDREWNGDDLPDREFYLTFDDGPTAPNGNTDDMLKLLQGQRKSAVFFVLGTNLRRRIDSSGAAAVSALYGNQCVADHGWEHHSHAKWDQWQESVVRTQTLILTTFRRENALALFRPPYGQRRPDSEAFFQSQSLHVALWNLDSLDWNSHIGPNDVAGRVIALMLIKRHGVLLFHDIHPKAAAALQVIFRQLGGGVSWGECHRLT
jgi:peptidoglycan-N-acetylglucosamine deacetylase